MNQATSTRRRPAARSNGHGTSPSASPLDATAREQARQLDAIFKALARRVLVDDDPAAEMPLRQLRVCMALFDEPHSMTQLSRELGVSQSAITQIADRLQAAGMVRRLPDDGDRRVRSLQLTPRARKMLRLRQQRRIERMMNILQGMSAADRAGVLASMSALREAAEDR